MSRCERSLPAVFRVCRHNGRFVNSAFTVIEETPADEGSRWAESLELRLAHFRLRLLAFVRARARRALARPRQFGADEPPVDSFDAAKRERMLWRVHDAARLAHLEWESGIDASEAMRDLAFALARVAEFDV
jgi:hypothetical protein